MPSYGVKDGLREFLSLGMSIINGSDANVSVMKFSVHSGTHVDAPGHFFDHYYDAGFDVDALDLEFLSGPALVVDVPRNKNITAEVMEALNIPKGCVVCSSEPLIPTAKYFLNYIFRKLMLKKEFDTSAVGFMEDGAKWLVDNTYRH
ncbi:hypothetical protein ACLB2K_020772 [Fragaria x ananassa]